MNKRKGLSTFRPFVLFKTTQISVVKSNQKWLTTAQQKRTGQRKGGPNFVSPLIANEEHCYLEAMKLGSGHSTIVTPLFNKIRGMASLEIHRINNHS